MPLAWVSLALTELKYEAQGLNSKLHQTDTSINRPLEPSHQKIFCVRVGLYLCCTDAFTLHFNYKGPASKIFTNNENALAVELEWYWNAASLEQRGDAPRGVRNREIPGGTPVKLDYLNNLCTYHF